MLVFIPLRWLSIGGCSLRRGGAGTLGGTCLIIGWWRDRAPSSSDDLAFGCCSIDGLHFGVIVNVKEAFGERFLCFYGRDLECKDSDLNESTSLWWRFFTSDNQMVDPYHKRKRDIRV